MYAATLYIVYWAVYSWILPLFEGEVSERFCCPAWILVRKEWRTKLAWRSYKGCPLGRRLLAELEGKEERAVPLLLGDNKGVVQLTRGVSNTSKIKHIVIAFHHVVDEVDQGKIGVYWVPGENMLADGMTKPLPREAFERNRRRIGIGPV
jgi:hypothetical protein